MPPSLLAKHIIRILEKKGFFFVSQKGSHAKYRSAHKPIRTVIVPMHGKEIPFGTIRSILRQSGLRLEDFL